MPGKVEFVSIKEMKTGRTKGQRYAKYAMAMADHLDSIKEGIDESSDNMVIVKMSQLKELLGMEHVKDKSVYWGLKFVMWTEGIAVRTATHKDGSSLIIFRDPQPGEKLPQSMANYSTETEDEIGIE